MSLPVKRQHDETATTLKGMDGKHHATGEPPATMDGALDSRPTKFARLEREGEKGSSEPMGSLPKREGPALEVTLGELHEPRGETKEVKDGREIKSKMRERVRDFLPEVKIDRDGRAGEIRDIKVERDLKDLRGDPKAEREVARHGWGTGAAKDGVRESKEFMVDRDGRDSRAADSKVERDLKERDVKVEKDVGRHAWGQVEVKEGLRESKDSTARYVKVEEPWVPGQDSGNIKDENLDVQSKKSPREDEGKSREPKEFSELKWEDQEKDDCKEKENEKKEEKRGDWKEDTTQAHLNVTDQKEIEREEKEKTEKEKDKEKSRDRERSREKEKESARGEKREKREKDKERDRDVQRRDRAEREDRETPGRERGDKDEVNEEDEVERKPGREVEHRKPVEKEGRERIRDRGREKERDGEGEGEKRKKRVREHEKDRDFIESLDGEGERDKDAVVSYGVQQRKRMLRPRGQSNTSNREARSRFRPKDTEGNQESSALQYRVGEGMPELAKLRKDFEAAAEKSSATQAGPTVEIRIPAELATTSNRQIRGSQLWGTDVYTDDSDIVAVLMHTGYYTPTGMPPPHSILELRATIRILESQKTYTSMLRNSLRSRAWGGGSGCSYSVERCRIIKAGGGSVELEPCLTRTPAVAPTLAPAASERTVTTRAASSMRRCVTPVNCELQSAYRQQRFVQEVTIQYNLCNEPWLKYSMAIVADHGLKKSQFTSARLKRGDVLYVETHSHRYELAYDGERMSCNGATTVTAIVPQSTPTLEKEKEKWNSLERAPGTYEKGDATHVYNGEKVHGSHPNNGERDEHIGPQYNGEPFERYRWSKCKRPLPLSSMRSKGVPLPAEFVEAVQEGLAWEEVQWSPTSVWVRGTEYILARAQFFSPQVEDMEE